MRKRMMTAHVTIRLTLRTKMKPFKIHKSSILIIVVKLITRRTLPRNRMSYSVAQINKLRGHLREYRSKEVKKFDE